MGRLARNACLIWQYQAGVPCQSSNILVDRLACLARVVKEVMVWAVKLKRGSCRGGQAEMGTDC